MKLFFLDQRALFLLYPLQTAVLILLYSLAVRFDIWIALYAMLLSTCLLALHLTHRYWRMAAFYRRLSDPNASPDAAFEDLGDSPLALSLDDLLRARHRHAQAQIHDYERRIRDHVTFINQWVHQMKTPLSVIQLTLAGEDEPIFHSLREETDRIRRGLDTVLYASRLDSFAHDFHVEPVSLHRVVLSVIAEHKAYFISSRVFPEIAVDESLRVYSDEKWLHFLLGQLVTNAVRYSAGTDSRVTFATRVQGRSVVLDITDRGVGIPPQDIKRVFDPYFTGENGRVFTESTGMGLYLVRQICLHLDHTVELRSAVGVGTTVSLHFPSHLTPA